MAFVTLYKIMCFLLLLFTFYFILLLLLFFTLQYCIGFAIHQHASATDRQHIKKQRRYFTNKGLSSQSYGFPGNHVWM